MPCEVHDSVVIKGETLDGSTEELTVWIRTQYDERVHIIGLELSNGEERANWKHPLLITRRMVNAIIALSDAYPCVLEKLFFISDDPARVRLNKRLFAQKGYNISEKFHGIYQVTKK